MLRTMVRVNGFVMMLLATGLMVSAPSFAHEGHAASAKVTKESAKTVELRQALRDLWIGHVFWTRNVALMTRLGDSQGAKVAEDNAVANARAIANAIAPLYGQPAADKLFGLLAGHYGAVKEYMMASYAGDKAGKDAATGKMVANVDEIAGFLSGANPNLPKSALVSLLTAHGGHHMAQIDDFASKDYAAEAQVWEAMKGHMYTIADALASGIAKQFPKKF
jgi:hypothetical protein